MAPLSLYRTSEKQDINTNFRRKTMFNDLDRTQIAAALLVGITSVAIHVSFYSLGMLSILHRAA